MISPAIVIAAYNRPSSLKRLLDSVAAGRYETNNIPLIISIDKSESHEVSSLADLFEWKHGDKRIIRYTEHLGLKEHIFRCGNLTNEYGSIIILEDDLIVSPQFYKYASQATSYYSLDRNIAGISLYSYQISENGFIPFHPFNDGTDVYFMQIPSSWGEIFTAQSWNDFIGWKNQDRGSFSQDILPRYVREWSAHSWKKLFIAYMILCNKYFVYPHSSYSTNYGEPGVNADRKGLYQVPLMFNDKKFSFVGFENSISVYDVSFEIIPDVLKKIDLRFAKYSLAVDMLGTKSLQEISQQFLLSSKPCKNPVLQFGNELPDPLQNILFNNSGKFFSLGKKEDFEDSQVDTAEFYITVKPVKDILFNPYIKQLHENFVFNQQFPKTFIGITHYGNADKLSETLNSIYKQSYPDPQLAVRIFYDETKETVETVSELKDFVQKIPFKSNTDFFKKFSDTIKISDSQYFVTMRSGDIFYDHVLTEINKIFRRYPDISWLTGIETIRAATGFNIFWGNTATRRWNSRIYERNLYKNSTRYIPPAATFWRQYTWSSAKPYLNFVSLENFHEDIWQAFFKVQKLFTCDLYISSTPIESLKSLKNRKTTEQYTLVEDKLISKLQEFFFINNFPYLRTYYKVKNNLPEVIRLDHKTQWYFQSDF